MSELSVPESGEGHQAIVNARLCPTCEAPAGEVYEVVDAAGRGCGLLESSMSLGWMDVSQMVCERL